LAAFNLVPGYPLDGGRILRAIIWWKNGDPDQATRSAARVGQIVAALFISIGIVQYFRGAGIGGLWIAFIGWFLLQAAGESRMQFSLKRAMQNVRVGDVMSHECPVVRPDATVQDLVDHELLRTGRRCFVVVGNGRVSGLVTPHEVKQIARDQWPYTTVEGIMLGLDKVHAIGPDESLMTALETMGSQNLNQLPVVSDGHLEGVVSRAEILSYLQTLAELKA
jgi:CBS domain-containing protein